MKNFRPFFAYFLRILYDSRTFSPLFGENLHFFQQKNRNRSVHGREDETAIWRGSEKFPFSLQEVLFPTQPSNDRIVVAGTDLVVDIAVVGLKVTGAHQLVDAEIETFLVIGNAQPTACLNVAVGETAG